MCFSVIADDCRLQKVKAIKKETREKVSHHHCLELIRSSIWCSFNGYCNHLLLTSWLKPLELNKIFIFILYGLKVTNVSNISLQRSYYNWTYHVYMYLSPGKQRHFFINPVQSCSPLGQALASRRLEAKLVWPWPRPRDLWPRDLWPQAWPMALA